MGSGGIVPPFLTSAPDESEWSASRPDCLTTGKIVPRTHSIGRWVGPRAGLNTVAKIKILLLPGFEPGVHNSNPICGLGICPDKWVLW
jgi:hypothetical protein